MEFPHYNHAISLNDFSFFPQQASAKIAEEFTVFKTTKMIKNKNKKNFSYFELTEILIAFFFKRFPEKQIKFIPNWRFDLRAKQVLQTSNT